MSDKLKEIFDSHQDKNIEVSFGEFGVSGKLMSKDAFVNIVSKILTQKSNGEKFKTLEEQHNYLIKNSI